MKRAIEDLDFEIEGVNIAIRVLMSQLELLEERREKVVKEIFNKEVDTT